MTLQTGAHDVTDLLAARFSSAVEYGLDTIEKVLQADIAAHNAIVSEMVADMCEMTTDRQRIYGTSAGGDMVEVDEYGKAPTQRAQPGATVGFPLKLFQFNLGWTYKWFQNHTPADMAVMVLAAEAAHYRRIQMELKKAIYGSANYTHLDHLVDNVSLAVKRFINADSAPIPNGPNGEVYTASSHTHYDGEASLTAVFLLAEINNVVEHGHGNKVYCAINTADEAAVRLLAGFSAYVDPRLVYRVTDTPARAVDISRLNNRAIGIFGGAEIWVKSWAIANYYFVWDAGDPNKPLAYRQREAAGLQGLRLAAELADYPLNAKDMEAEFGIGVWTRTNGAVLYDDNATYADPTITG